MADIWTDALAILAACLLIAAGTGAVLVFRPSARRHRRHRRRSRRPRIDLFDPSKAPPPPETGA